MSSEPGSPSDEPRDASHKDAGKKSSRRPQDVTDPLRTAFEKVIEEPIPQSMLDLLKQLN